MRFRLMICFCLILSSIALFSVAPAQTPSGSLTPNEQYRQISRLLAQQDYEQAIAACKALIEQSPNYHNAYLGLALASAHAGQLEPTRAWLDSLLARTPPQPMAYVGLAMLREVKRDSEAAVENYQNCLRALPDDYHVAMLMANDYVNGAKGEEGERYFKSLLAVRPDSVAAHQGLAILYWRLERRSEALREFDRTIELLPENLDAHFHKGLVLVKDGRHSPAIETFQNCLRLLRANPDDLMERSVLGQLGALYRQTGNYSEAATILDRVLALARASEDLQNEESALAQIASVHYRQSSYLKALEYWRQALEVSKVITSRKVRIKTYPQRHIGSIGDVYYRLGDLTAAEQAYLEALTLSAEDQAHESSVLKSLGDLYIEQGKLSEALAIVERALAIGEREANLPNQLGALNSVSALHRQMGDAPKAMQYVQRALKMLEGRTNPVWQGESLNNLGLLHLRFGATPEAVAAFQKTLAIDPKTMSPHIVWQAHSGLAGAYVQLGQPDRAREHYQKAIEAMENVRARLGGEEEKAGFFQDKVEVYKKLIRLLVDPRLRQADSHNGAAAFHYAERGRARAFLDLLAEAGVNVEQNAAPDLLKQKQELQQRISQLTAQLIKERSQETSKQDQARIAELEKGLGRADAEFGDWLRELRRRNPRYAALKYPTPVTLAEAQRLLDDKTVLLSYSLADPESFLFAVTRDDFQVRRLPAEAKLGESVQKLLAAITDKNNPAPQEYRRQAAQLSQQLLPANRMLAGKTALVIVADGALHRLPFEALLRPGSPARGDLRQFPYLIRSFAISYVPSASVLAQLQHEPRETAPKGFIAFGDPMYEQRPAGGVGLALRASSAGGRLNLQRLPYSHTEIEGIAKLFAKDDRELFFGEAASEENVKTPERLSRYRLIHFSTHGYVNEARPRFSGLVLSLPPAAWPSANNPQSAIRNRQSEDGLLSAYEIFNLKLNADLVVLSACETGLGKEVKGEGLMSLTRAFMYAGTPSVVVSLWKVNDESAADLMIRFYGHLQAGMNKSEALRQAQLETIHDNGFPFFWAPFVLVGKA